MGLHSDRKEFYEQEAKNEKLADTGRKIRALPEREQQKAMDTLKSFGIDVDEAMHQSATSHWDKYW